MNRHLKIFISILSVGMLYSTASSAFFFPSPLPGKDAFNLAMDKVENYTAKLNEAQQKLASLKKAKEKIKSGDFGVGDFKAYANVLKSIDFESLIPEMKIPNIFAANVNDQDQMAEAARENLIPVYTEDGNHSVIAKQQNIKRTEIQQNTASTLFAHNHVTRYNLAQERKTIAPEIDVTNSRQILQASLAVKNTMLKRWNDMAYTQTKIQEYQFGQALMTMSLTESNAKKISSGEGGV